MVDINGVPEEEDSERPIEEAISKPSKSEEHEVLGITSDYPFTTWNDFAWGRQDKAKENVFLLGKNSHAVPLEKLREMRRRDTQTRSLLRLFSMPIESCLKEGKWVKAPWVEDGDDEVDFANMMFRTPAQAGGMQIPIELILKQTLLAIIEGFAAFEEVYHQPKVGPMKGKWTLESLEYRDSRTVNVLVDKWGRYAGFRQQARRPDGTLLDVNIPKEKSLLYTVGAEENPYVGVSMFESAWFHYDTKTKLYYLSSKAAQFAAVPGRIGTYPAQGTTPAKRAAFAAAIRDFASNASMMIPDGYKVEPFATSTGFEFIKLIEHHSHMQAKSVLLQFMDNDNRMAIIDNGGQDASADMFVQGLMSIMNGIAQMWTSQLMPKFIDWNFGSGKYPIWQFGELTDSARGAIEQAFTTMVTSSTLNSTPEFFRGIEKNMASRLGLDIDYKEIEKREAEAAKKAAELAKAEADALEAAQEAEGIIADAETSGPTAQKMGIQANQPTPGDPNGPDLGSQNAPGIGQTTPEAQAAQDPSAAQQMAGMSKLQSDLDDLVNLAAELSYLDDSPIYDYDERADFVEDDEDYDYDEYEDEDDFDDGFIDVEDDDA